MTGFTPTYRWPHSNLPWAKTSVITYISTMQVEVCMHDRFYPTMKVATLQLPPQAKTLVVTYISTMQVEVCVHRLTLLILVSPKGSLDPLILATVCVVRGALNCRIWDYLCHGDRLCTLRRHTRSHWHKQPPRPFITLRPFMSPQSSAYCRKWAVARIETV